MSARGISSSTRNPLPPCATARSFLPPPIQFGIARLPPMKLLLRISNERAANSKTLKWWRTAIWSPRAPGWTCPFSCVNSSRCCAHLKKIPPVVQKPCERNDYSHGRNVIPGTAGDLCVREWIPDADSLQARCRAFRSWHNQAASLLRLYNDPILRKTFLTGTHESIGAHSPAPDMPQISCRVDRLDGVRLDGADTLAGFARTLRPRHASGT